MVENNLSQKPIVQISKTTHREQTVIICTFAYDINLLKALKTIPGLKYSKSLSAWYLPYTKDAWAAFVALKVPYWIDHPGTTGSARPISENALKNNTDDPGPDDKTKKDVIYRVEIHYNNQRFWVKLPYHPGDVSMIKNLKGAYWNNGQKLWSVTANTDNLTNLQSHFNYWSPEVYYRIYNLILECCDPKIVEIFHTPEYKDVVCVRLKGYGIDRPSAWCRWRFH